MLLIKLVHSNEQICFDLNLPGTKGGIEKKKKHTYSTNAWGRGGIDIL